LSVCESPEIDMDQKQSGAAKVMAVLDVLGSADPAEFPHGPTAADVARLLGRERSVVSRQLRSLLETGLVSRTPAGHYTLSWRLYGLAVRAGDRLLTRAAVPLMFRLTALVRERSYLTVLSGGEVLTVHSESSHRPGEAAGWAGRTVPVNCCASGMALLLDHDDEHIVDIVRRGPNGIGPRETQDYLARVRAARRSGFAVADRIFGPELVGIGAAVRDRAGRIVAAVNLSGPGPRVEPQLQAFAGQLLSTVRGLQRAVEPRAGVPA
jgi:DNA-binding IclR family transcriptional regulator